MKRSLACLLLISTVASAQTLTGKGKVIAKGTVTVGAQSSQYVRIFALFPPETDPDRSNHFALYTMKASAIDGVTDTAIWSSVETATPGVNTCTPVGTDQCQLDAFGWTHQFDWTSVDSKLAYWFNTGNPNGFGTKNVNVIAVGQTEAAPPNNVNLGTPYYVTTSSWISHTGGAQHVINSEQNACSPYVGPPTTTPLINSDASGVATATVSAITLNQGTGFVVGDTVWVTGATPTSLNTGTSGTAIKSVSGTTFTYQSGCNSCTSTTQANVITNVLSWLVPYETPMKTALKTFIAAGIQHFGPNHSGTTVKPAQVYYMRFGKSAGGESFVYCTSSLPAFPPGTPYAPATWQNYITEMTNFEQAQSPTMLVFEPINRVNGDDADYPNYEAKDAIAHSNTYGGTFGFGSQGLSLYDSIQFPLGHACASNWCGNFNTYYAQGSPLELQQIANSDPTDQSCGSGGVNCIPGGDSGDLRVWLPFAVGPPSRHLNVLELYSVDADLAFDPQFCVLNVGATMCISGSYGSLNGLSAAQQLKFFQPDATYPPPDKSGVGLGNTNSCYTGSGLQTGALGDCSYSTAINAAHGYH
jgi:hypothetical protein